MFTEKQDTHSHLTLAKKPQLIIPSAFLCFQLQDFGLKGLFSGKSLVFHLVDLETRKNFKLSDVVKHILSCVPDLFSRNTDSIKDWKGTKRFQEQDTGWIVMYQNNQNNQRVAEQICPYMYMSEMVSLKFKTVRLSVIKH